MKKTVINLWRLLFPVVIYFGISVVVEMGYMIWFGMKTGVFEGTTPVDVEIFMQDFVQYVNTNSLYFTTILNAVLIPILSIGVYNDEKRRKAATGIVYSQPEVKQYALVGILGMCAAISVNMIISLTGLAYFSPTYQEVSEIIYSGSIWIELLAAVIAAPIVEELLFRGLIYKRLLVWVSPKVGMIISSAIFGLFHGNLVQFVYAFIIGFLLAYMYEKCKTIWVPIIFHVCANLIAVLITELVPEQFMNIITLLVVMVATSVGTVVLIKYFRKYEVEEKAV